LFFVRREGRNGNVVVGSKFGCVDAPAELQAAAARGNIKRRDHGERRTEMNYET